MAIYTLGTDIPFPMSPTSVATYSDMTRAMPTPEDPINGTHGQRNISITMLGRYTVLGTDDTQFIDIYRVEVDGCTVANDCPAAFHTALLADIQTTHNGASTQHCIVDFPQLCVYGRYGDGGAPLLGYYGFGDATDLAMSNLLRNTMQAAVGSFQWNGTRRDSDSPYYMTVFEGAIGHNPEVNISMPVAKRLITRGESVLLHDDQRVTLHSVYFGDVIRGSETNTAESPVEPATEPVDVEALQQRINFLSDLCDRREAMIEKAGRVAISYTRENGGCNDGKYGFLSDLGLWPDFDRAEILELVGIVERADYVVDCTVTIPISVTVTLDGDDVDDLGTYELSQHVDTDQLDAAIRDAIQHTNADIVDIDNVERA